jgi:hypothetical protein
LNRGLVLFTSAVALATQARAEPQAVRPFKTSQPESQAHRSVSFRLVADREFDPAPVHHSGIVAQTVVAPNASIGIGLLSSRPKKPSGDWTLDNRAPSSRKTTVSFLLKF